MSEYVNLPDELFKGLSEFYIKYINVKQDETKSVLPEQGANKFNVVFDKIKELLGNAFNNTLEKKPYTCKGYQTRYREFFEEELKKIKNMGKIPKMLELKKQLIEHIIGVIEKITPDKLPTYSTFSTNAETCGNSYYPLFLQIIDKIIEKIKNDAIAFMYSKIKDVAKEEIKNEMEDVSSIVDILDGDKKSEEIATNEIKGYIENILDISNQRLDKEITSKYIVDELTTKYNEFLNLQTASFNQEIKNKIKKSIVEIVLIESKLNKIYNPKRSLLFSKAIKEFFEQK